MLNADAVINNSSQKVGGSGPRKKHIGSTRLMRSIVMSVSVCLCVCLSVRDHIYGTTRPIFTSFLCMLPMAVARSFTGGVVIRYILPVLWITS